MPFYADDALKSQLNAAGLRATTQRQKILSIFQALPQGEHLSAEQMHRVLGGQGERISLSTVYRTLHLMVNMGLLRELELAEGHKYYELSRDTQEQHHHLVCVQCGQTIEFAADSIDQLGERQAQASGYHVLDCQLTLYGVCPSCNR